MPAPVPLHADSAPHAHGHLPTDDGHELYWETCGNPEGLPALVLHGGPGSGCSPRFRRYFDPARYRIVLLDQRGAGRSRPHASDPAHDLATNTTPHLIADLEALRAHLGIDRWLVWGVSFGSFLGLRYAQLHPARVSALVLTGVATGSRAEVEVLTRGLGRYFPEAFDRFRAGVPEAARDGDLATAYRDLLVSPDPAVRALAARDWTDWETAIIPAPPRSEPRYEDPRFRLGFVRTVTHYWSQDHFLGGDEVVLRDAHRLHGIPGTLVQGLLDPGNLTGAVHRLAAAWPDASLHVVNDGVHGANAEMAGHLVAATDRYADEAGA
ncbi:MULTISPECIES: prolyl aminopeptidase [unclassified Streptomyces]|uniref:prolyl aminopeptidase n=1 Tax=unclassified Streptomyces TaxID=2593676 RepID=UPI000BAC9CC0|nr:MULTISPECIES: prolyl aminopeptidase [unclassified Streptomyces]ASY35504.1 prolyl aminopeptidase [Streptomyces sp. CLI2509]MYX24755.1 prolyl aminopeptidase [Streptomyces sp. SID8380]